MVLPYGSFLLFVLGGTLYYGGSIGNINRGILDAICRTVHADHWRAVLGPFYSFLLLINALHSMDMARVSKSATERLRLRYPFPLLAPDARLLQHPLSSHSLAVSRIRCQLQKLHYLASHSTEHILLITSNRCLLLYARSAEYKTRGRANKSGMGKPRPA